MSKEKRRVPKLRFPGFTEDWEQCKLNEFLSVSNLKNTEDKYNKKDVLSVSGDYGIVNQIEFQGRSFAGVSVSNYGVVETGDIVYTKSPLKLNPYGIIKTNRINNGIVSTLYAIYKTKENCDSKFIEHYFNLDSRLNKYLKPLVNKGAKNDMKVSSENALIGEVCFPHITEQKLIADFLDWLDVYITLHQRKLEHLNLKKKALLQKLFPKDGERYPELRFPGFTDAWEQRKLGAMCSLFIDGDWIESKDQSNEGIRLIQTGNIGVGKFIDKPENKKWISHSTFNNLRCKELLDGDILISRLPQPAGRACIVNTNNEKWITAVDCTIVRLLDQYSNKFILQSLCTYNYFHLIDSFLAGGTRQRVSRSNLSDINIMSPKKIEQDKIGLFFEYVDNLITLHQRKLEDLQLQKKALLQQMFV